MQCPHLEEKKKVTTVTNTRHKERWRVGMCVGGWDGSREGGMMEGRDGELTATTHRTVKDGVMILKYRLLTHCINSPLHGR